MSENDKKEGTARVGGSSAVDDALRPVVQNFVAGMLDMFADHRGVDAMLRELSPTVRAATKFLPMGAGYLMAKLPAAYFKSPEVAHFVQDIVVEASRHIDKIVQAKGSPDQVTPTELNDALKKGYEAAAQKKYVVDPTRTFHAPSCVNLSHFRRQPFQKKGDQQPPPPQNNLAEVTFKEAMEQDLKPCLHCLKRIQADLKPAEAPKADKKPRSPLDILGSFKDEELRKQFAVWYKGLTTEQRAEANQGLQELDSEAEFMGFMALDPALRMEAIGLLKTRNASHAVGNFLNILGSAIKAGSKETLEVLKKAWAGYKKFDDSLAPLVVKLQADLKKPRDEKSGWDWLKMFLPFNT